MLDVRPEDEFALGHVLGAVNIPLRELEARLAELDPSQEIVAYCRSPYCVLSYEAVATLAHAGHSRRGGWRRGFRNGERPDCQSKSRESDVMQHRVRRQERKCSDTAA